MVIEYELKRRMRFKNRVCIDQESGCHEWTGAISSTGYGNFYFYGVVRRAHRVAIYFKTGRDLVLNKEKTNVVDHICRNRICVNPDHLRLVTYQVNCTENSTGQCATNSKKKYCLNGHSLSGENLMIEKDGKGNFRKRRCKICRYR